MRIHGAIVAPAYVEPILTRRKTIETRLYRRRLLPFDRIRPGDTVHFKLAGGPVVGSARVRAVRQFADLAPADVEALRRRYNRRICAPPAFWAARRNARYAVLIWLGRPRRPARPVAMARQFGSAWVILDRRRPGRPRARRA